jgi:hypothetical protein
MIEYQHTLSPEKRSFLVETYKNQNSMNPRDGAVSETINSVLWAMANPSYSFLYDLILEELEEFGFVQMRTINTSNGPKRFISVTESGLSSIDGKVTIH